MGLISNLNFDKATEARRDLEDGEYDVEIGLCYNKVTNKAGPKIFTEFKVLTGARAGAEVAWRQGFNNMTASALAQCVAACLGFDLTNPLHKQTFDSAYPAPKLTALCDEIWEGRNPMLKGKQVHLKIETIKTQGGQDFRKHTFSPKTA